MRFKIKKVKKKKLADIEARRTRPDLKLSKLRR